MNVEGKSANIRQTTPHYALMMEARLSLKDYQIRQSFKKVLFNKNVHSWVTKALAKCIKYILHYITCQLADAFIQSDLQ